MNPKGGIRALLRFAHPGFVSSISALILSGCTVERPLSMLNPAGPNAEHIARLSWEMFTVYGIVFVVTLALLAAALIAGKREQPLLGTQFFNPHLGGSSLLWQHLFWWFGHPEVYIIFLPATGIVSEIVPVFTRRRLVAHPLVIAALITIGFVSFGLWSHHMFTTGIPHLPMHFFTAASFMISLASGVQIFAWIATLWGSRPRWNVQILYILGFFFIFVNGGLTGVMVATMAFDFQVHETNFVVAHLHHVLIGGAVLPFIAGLHYWLPKVSGRMFSERWGKAAFWPVFLGFNFTFVPMYVIGIFGMRRRVYTFSEDLGVGTLNLVSTLGAYLLAAGFALTLLNLLWHSRRGRAAGADPWEGGSLESGRRTRSASAPASSTPVGPPPTITNVSSNLLSARLSAALARSIRLRIQLRAAIAWATVLNGSACSLAPGMPR